MPGPEPCSRRLVAIELPDGRAVLAGLPADHAERMSLCLRLLDSLRAEVHALDTGGEGVGALWDQYAKESYVAGWLPLAQTALADGEGQGHSS